MKLLLLLLLVFSGFAEERPVRILVVYHSESGHTEKLARAVQRGAASVEGVEAVFKKTGEVKPGEIVSYDGIMVGTPVHWSNASAEVRRFMDVVGDALWKAKANGDGRTAGVFCTGGGTAMGKDVARWSVLSAFLTMRFLVIGGVDDAGFGTLGAEATTGPADPGVSAAEETEAVRFGERFARMTRQLRKGAAK
jgi:NAD(P)H dehydrogenase (quinone)